MNGGVNSHNQTNSTIIQGVFVTEMSISSEKTEWFNVNSHPYHDIFTPRVQGLNMSPSGGSSSLLIHITHGFWLF